jgi:Flp pilus assembly protein TadD
VVEAYQKPFCRTKIKDHVVDCKFGLVIGSEESFYRYYMRILKITAVVALALSSFAAENIAPTKTELEEMYNKAFREFDANNFPQALKELDAIDARQPELAPSQNLRGVILMRQGVYDKAEAALLEAARIDPKFWNARFNLAEIPFLKKDWAEARKRFEQLLSSGQSDLAGEASQLIQYKVLLTYLLEGKENMVDSILAKLELSPDTPAVDYVKAAVALQHKSEKEAKDWIAVAEKKFSPQLNKLFAESLFEVGWLKKPAGQARASLPLMTAAERAEKTKAVAHSKFEQAQQALRQRDFGTAAKLVDEADQADPNQPTILNLRGEILMEQKQFDEAEAVFKRAAKLDPKFREAQYNLAQIPFKKKDYAKARERFEALFERTPGGDKNQAAQLIKFKIYMTFLLEGKESRAQAIMEQFQFTGDTPALYYAQAAWEFKHNNPEKAADWTASAKRIYSPALNSVFADAFYDVGWVQSPEIAAASESAFDVATVMTTQTEASPAIEPSPIPDTLVAASKQVKESNVEPLSSSVSGAGTAIAGIGTNFSESKQSSAGASNKQVSAGAPEESKDAALPSTAASAVESPVAASVAAQAPAPTETKTSGEVSSRVSPVTAQPAAMPAAARIGAWSPSAVGGLASSRTLLVGGLLLAGMFLLAWVIAPELGRAFSTISRSYSYDRPLARPRTLESNIASNIAPSENRIGISNHVFGGPRQVSLRLTASKPPSRIDAFRPAIDLNGGASEASTYQRTEPHRESPPIAKLAFESSLSPILNQTAKVSSPVIRKTPELTERRAISELRTTSAVSAEDPGASPIVAEAATTPAMEQIGAPEIEPIGLEQAIAQVPTPTEGPGASPVVAEAATTPVMEPIGAPEIEPIGLEQAIAQVPTPTEGPGAVPVIAEAATRPEMEPLAASEIEPIRQEQAIPHQTPVSAMDPSVVEAIHDTPSHLPITTANEPVKPQITTAPTMPEHLETTAVPTAPPIKTPTAEDASRPASGMHTTVQLTFSFEVASVQMTPTFKVSTLQVRPTSKVVTMRLGSGQGSQPATNSEVTFEIAKIQPTGGAFGNIRMTPSRQQKPTAAGSPSFMVEGSQLVPNFEGTSVQLTPSQQAKASVLVTVPCQINTIEFSPSFEVASVALNSSSKQVFVQLPSGSPGAGEGTPMFEIANLELSESGDISMMQLNLV